MSLMINPIVIPLIDFDRWKEYYMWIDGIDMERYVDYDVDFATGKDYVPYLKFSDPQLAMIFKLRFDL